MFKCIYIRTILIIIVIFPVVLMGDSEDSVPVVNWHRLDTAWQAYLYYPSCDNALNVYKLLPSSGHIDYTYSQIEKDVMDSILENITLLERQIYASDTNAIKVAFRLLSISDGAFTEVLCMILGNLIRINPQLFLKELADNPDWMVILGSLVGNFGDEYIDKMRARELEVSDRIKALQSVQDEELLMLREECIKALKK